MVLSKLINDIKIFYRNSYKIAVWVTILILSQVMGFIPALPAMAIYGLLIVFSIIVIIQGYTGFNTFLTLFVIYIPIEIIVSNPDPFFNSWMRYGLFVLVLICASPLIKGKKQSKMRSDMLSTGMFIAALLGVGSFFAKIAGINLMHQLYSDVGNSSGSFGGLVKHSMLLGPIAGIGTVYLIYNGWRYRSYILYLCSFCSLLSVMFSASRASLAATIAAICILFYKLSNSTGKLVKTILIVVSLSTLSYPLWEDALIPLKQKQERNYEQGGSFASRDVLWEESLQEFTSSPLFGVGFDAIDFNISTHKAYSTKVTGVIESGSSWLSILSMTGLLGAFLLFPFFFQAFYNTYRSRKKESCIVSAVLTLFYIHMTAEGYIFFGGNTLAFLMWLTAGVAYDFSSKS